MLEGGTEGALTPWQFVVLQNRKERETDIWRICPPKIKVLTWSLIRLGHSNSVSQSFYVLCKL